MKKMIFGVVFAAVVALTMTAPTANAAVVNCTSPAITSVVASLGPGLNSCFVTGASGTLFSNFTVSPTSATVGIDTNPLDTFVAGSEVVLGFQLSGITPDANGNFDLLLFYQVTGGISGIDLGLQASINPDHRSGNVTLTEIACSQAFTSSSCGGTTFANITATSTGSFASAIQTFSTQNTVFIKKDIQFNNFATLSEISDSVVIPEPMTLSLMGAGLLGLGLMRRRFNK